MKKVLIIDDDQFILKVYQKKFETEGLLVEVADNAAAAITALKSDCPALIILDLMLPGMNGAELLEHIRRIPGCAEVPTIVFSHSFNDELLDAARAAGAIQCLNKNSVSPNRLMEIVRSALAVPAAGLAAATPAQPTAPAGDRAKARAALAHNATATDAKLNVLLQAFAAAADSKERLSALAPLRTSFKHLADEADTAALPRLIMLAHSVDIMLQDLQEHPDEITTSSFRVLARAMEVIPSLFLARPQPEREPPVLAAVVHTQRGVAPLLAESLRLVGQPAVAFRDTDSAIAFSENNPLGLVIVDLELARPDGGDFVRRSQAIPGHAHVPAVLLSNQPPAATLVPSYLLAHQVLNYPFTASEVVVSAVVRMVKRA